MDQLLQPRIGSLYHGVSRQSALLRSPSQMQELDNFLPSVDLGGFVDRIGTRYLGNSPTPYAANDHHMFETGDGQLWALMRPSGSPTIEVRNLRTGAVASITYGPYTQAYMGYAGNLKYCTVSDTTYIVNPGVAVAVSVPPVPAKTTMYLVVVKLSAGAQTFQFTSPAGNGSWALAQGAGNIVGRDFVALGLSQNIASNCPGLSVVRVSPNVIRITGPAEILAQATFSNDWDTTAALAIKGKVSSLADLPAIFESGIPILVDLGTGDVKSQYYVMYDGSQNAWIECSYLTSGATTATLNPSTLPIRLHQVTANSFELQPCDWVPRKTGDDKSNPHPGFVNQTINAIAHWKGRLWLASGSSVYSSQPDDLYNFYRTSARSVDPSDPVSLDSDVNDAPTIQWLSAFNSKLVAMCGTAQLEVLGDKPITPTAAVMGVATRYQVDLNCEPAVVGDAMYFTGPSANRAAFWEYRYNLDTSGNQADDLAKHVPGYIPGPVRRIAGSAQSGRVFAWTPNDPSRLYVQTSYWKDNQRAQNAWSKLTFAGVGYIQHHWVYQDTLYIAANGVGGTAFLSVKVDSDLGTNGLDSVRLDYLATSQVTWNLTLNRSEVLLPAGFEGQTTVVALVDMGDGWFRQFPLTTIYDGTQWLGHFPDNIGIHVCYVGFLFGRSAEFSPMYPSDANGHQTPAGRLQVHNVMIDTMVSCDFAATVKRADRIDMVTAVSPRSIGTALVPTIGQDETFTVPFNAKGDKGRLLVTSISTGPLCVTGLTLKSRYTNPTA